MNVIAAAQGQVHQMLQLCEDREAVGHQQRAVTEKVTTVMQDRHGDAVV